MTRVAIEELNENSLSCFHEEGRIILTVRGHDVAVIVPADEMIRAEAKRAAGRSGRPPNESWCES